MATAAAYPKHIVLAEGGDARVLDASEIIVRQKMAKLTLLGDEATIKAELRRRGVHQDIEIVDPRVDLRLEGYVKKYTDLCASRLSETDDAERAMSDPLCFAAMMVRQGEADGTIAGAASTTADVVRAGLRIIGKLPNNRWVSSFFLMCPKEGLGPFGHPIIFADCAMVIEPDADALADIAMSSARSAQSFLDEPPRVAMLSFSTAGSATHPRAVLVQEATDIVRQQWPDLEIVGEIQFDAAIDADIRERKSPNYPLQNLPNVFIFPNLDAANIGYKIAERIGGMKAIGPVLQGLAKPANDLSRGCSVDDIVALIALTACQAASNETHTR